MKGIVFLGQHKLEIQEFEDPTPGPDEVILEIKASGMCGSDLKVYRAVDGPSSLGLGGEDKQVIAGHEPCGTIVELGKNVNKNNFKKVKKGPKTLKIYKGLRKGEEKSDF